MVLWSRLDRPAAWVGADVSLRCRTDTEITGAFTVVLLGTKSRASGCCEQTSSHIAGIHKQLTCLRGFYLLYDNAFALRAANIVWPLPPIYTYPDSRLAADPACHR